jgi:hypothetical protein
VILNTAIDQSKLSASKLDEDQARRDAAHASPDEHDAEVAA